MKCRYVYYTDVGGRENNEDSVLAVKKQDKRLFVVADGLGGHDCGEVASGIAVAEIVRQFDEQADFDPVAAVLEANRLILQKQADTGLKMKTTVALAYINGDKTTVAHVGDSRVYLFDDEKIVFQTLDHSASQIAVNVGDIKPSEIRHHEDRNVLTRVLGATENLKVDTTEFSNDMFDRVLICSDGFWEYVLEEDMLASLANSSRPASWLRRMRSIHRGSAPKNCDNNTAVAAFLDR